MENDSWVKGKLLEAAAIVEEVAGNKSTSLPGYACLEAMTFVSRLRFFAQHLPPAPITKESR